MNDIKRFFQSQLTRVITCTVAAFLSGSFLLPSILNANSDIVVIAGPILFVLSFLYVSIKWAWTPYNKCNDC